MNWLKTIIAACAFAALMTLPGAAQAPAGYGTPMTLEQAKKAMAAAEAEAGKNNLSMVIAIVDSSGHLLALHRMDNSSYGSIRVAIGKAETALDFRQSTKILDDRLASGGSALQTLDARRRDLDRGRTADHSRRQNCRGDWRFRRGCSARRAGRKGRCRRGSVIRSEQAWRRA